MDHVLIFNDFTLFAFLFIALCVITSKQFGGMRESSNKLSQKTLETFSQLPSLPLIGPLFHAASHQQDMGNLAISWRKIYGPCWLTSIFGKKLFSINDARLIKPLLASNDIGHLEKVNLIYKNLIVGAGFNGLLSMPAKDWGPHRKALSPLFTYESLKNYVGIYKKHAERLAADLMTMSESNHLSKRPSYKTLVHLRTLDIITEILVGVPFESVLGKKGALKFYEDLSIVIRIASGRISHRVWKLFPALWYFDPERKVLNKHLHDVEAAVDKVREFHVKQENSRFALDLMLNQNWSNDEIKAEMMTLIVGGHDTVSSAMVTHIWLLAINQEHQKACQEEVDMLFDRLEESKEELALGDLSELKYLERCIKESLRIFPSTSVGTHRELKTPLKLDEDNVLEPGSLVAFAPYILHRDPEVFPEPEKFDPDRFLPENVRNRHPYAYLPFSAGPRNCLGNKAAMLELTVLSAMILRHFNLSTTDQRDDIKPVFRFTVDTSKEPNVIFQRRR